MNIELADKIDIIFNYIEYLCINEDFATVDRILSTIDYHKYSNDELLSYLTITIPFKDKLSQRIYLASIVGNIIRESHSKKETEIIMKGLK